MLEDCLNCSASGVNASLSLDYGGGSGGDGNLSWTTTTTVTNGTNSSSVDVSYDDLIFIGLTSAILGLLILVTIIGKSSVQFIFLFICIYLRARIGRRDPYYLTGPLNRVVYHVHIIRK